MREDAAKRATGAARAGAALTAAVAAVALWLGAPPAGACACGLAIDASVSEESGLVIERPGGESIVLSLDLSTDPGGRAAIVLPVPGVPTVAAVMHGDPLAYLAVATAPERAPGSGGDEAVAAAPAVDVIGRENVGGYDVARLGAGDALALNAWLDRNGYALPPGAEPILADYVAEGWRFVAIRLAPEASGRLKPLEVSFATDEQVYPMRLEQLGTVPLDLTLYTLADGPRAVAGMRTAWEGGVGELSPPPPPGLRALFDQGDYVTRMEALDVQPTAFADDLAIEPAPGGLAAQPAPVAAQEPLEAGGISTGSLVAIVLAGLAFALGIALLTRTDSG